MRKICNNLNIKAIDIIIFTIPFLFFLFCLYIFFPGIYNFDVFEQLRQIRFNDFSNGHPFISTFYIMIFHKFIGIKSSLPMFQIIWFSFIWCKICKYNRSNNSKRLYIIQILFTIFVSLNPMINTTIISNNKDSLFFLLFLSICFEFQKHIDKSFNVKYREIIILSFLLVFFMNVRHNGYYTCIVFIPFLLLLIFLKTFKDNKKIIIIYIVSFLSFNYLFTLPSKIYNVKNTGGDSSSVGISKALQMQGYMLNENVLTEKEISDLAMFVDIESLKQSVNYTWLDTLFSVKKTNYFENNKSEFILYSLNTIKKHPYQAFKFYHISSTLIWDVVVKDGSVYNCLWFYINSPNRPIDIDYINAHLGIHKFVYNVLIKSQNNKFARVILYSPAVCMYISLIIIFILLFKYKYKKIWLLYIFNMINVLILSLCIPVQDTRYLLNNFALLYLLVIIMINKIFEYKSNSYREMQVDYYKVRSKGDNMRVLLIVPSFNEEKNVLSNYKKIVNYNKKNDTNYDVIIINDGSTDRTEEICIDNNIPHISLVHNLGIGGAVQTGYKYALENNYDIAIQFDGDGQHDINYVSKIIEPIINGNADMVIGSRFIDKNSSEFKSSKARRIGINIISFFIKLVTGKKVFDTTSGFRAVNVNLIKYFAFNYPVEYPEPVSTVDILKKGYFIEEIPVSMNERENGVSSIRTWKKVYYMVNVVLSIIVSGMGGKK